MSLHAFEPDRTAPVPPGTMLPHVPVASDRLSPAGPLPSFVVRLRFATPAARADGFEVVAAEARVGVPGGAVRLGRVAEVAARDLVVRVDGVADPDAALGAATEALRESLVTFRVTGIAPPHAAARMPA